MIKKRNRKISEIIRVDHAGELGAKYIYLGQLAILKDNKKIKEMYEQELEHLKFFEEQLVERKVRPSFFIPLWRIGGFLMGACSAIMGEKTAMACTVAVEEVIGDHYNSQIKSLTPLKEEAKLLTKIKKFRDDELDHKNTGLQAGAQNIKSYYIYSQIIENISKTAIFIAKRL